MSRSDIAYRYKSDAPVSKDQRIACVASRQAGVVSAAQAIECGFTRSAIQRRLQTGRWHKILHGIYSVGHFGLDSTMLMWAGVLWAGDGSAVTGRSAAWIWRIVRYEPSVITVVGRSKHGLEFPGLAVTRSRSLVSGDASGRPGVPIATPARAIVDLADSMSAHDIAHVMHQASYRGLLDLHDLQKCMHRNRTRCGARSLHTALESHLNGSAGLRSRLEARLLESLILAGIPEPLLNTRVRAGSRTIEVDFHWPAPRLVVEVDGPGHARARTKLQDARRDAALLRAGYRVLRISHSEINQSLDKAVSRIAVALRPREWPLARASLNLHVPFVNASLSVLTVRCCIEASIDHGGSQ